MTSGLLQRRTGRTSHEQRDQDMSSPRKQLVKVPGGRERMAPCGNRRAAGRRGRDGGGSREGGQARSDGPSGSGQTGSVLFLAQGEAFSGFSAGACMICSSLIKIEMICKEADP